MQSMQKIRRERFDTVFLVVSLESGVYFMFTAHLSLDEPLVKCSVATCG